MNCPACRRGLPAGPNDRCPFCGTRLSGPTEGALAAEPAPVTPNPRESGGPIREIPGLRKRERTWKDDVRDRVRERREKRGADAELPLFRDDTVGEEEERAAGQASAGALDADAGAPLGLVSHPEDLDHSQPSGPRELGESSGSGHDLPLRPREAGGWALGDEAERWAELTPGPAAKMDDVPAEPDREGERKSVPPVERPALPLERLLAGLVDLALLAVVWSGIVYLASRAARVPVSALLSAWPWLAAYLAALGLLYAGYFTGTTGQTPGKMLKRLHVLDLAGGPPGHVRAVARAVVGSLGVVLAGGALWPMLFDPARRALHDRLLRTRVVRL